MGDLQTFEERARKGVLVCSGKRKQCKRLLMGISPVCFVYYLQHFYIVFHCEIDFRIPSLVHVAHILLLFSFEIT